MRLMTPLYSILYPSFSSLWKQKHTARTKPLDKWLESSFIEGDVMSNVFMTRFVKHTAIGDLDKEDLMDFRLADQNQHRTELGPPNMGVS